MTTFPSPSAERKRIQDMTDAELRELRWSQSVIGTRQECLIVDVYSQDGKVIAIPCDEDAREKAADEVKAIALQKFRSLSSHD